MEQEVLEKIGLSPNEAKVYLALITLGSASVTQIAKKADVHRVNIYDVLERLMEKGLVSAVIKTNKKYFEAANPERLKEIIEEKKKNLDKAEFYIPELISTFNLSKFKQEVHHFKGKNGLKTIFEDILKTKSKEWLMFGSPGKGPKILPNYIQQWENRRIKIKIKLRGIMNDAEDGRKRGEDLSRLKFTEIKYLPKGYLSPADTYIYDDKTVIVLWSEKDIPIAIMVENKEIANGFRSHFEWFWKITKKLKIK